MCHGGLFLSTPRNGVEIEENTELTNRASINGVACLVSITSGIRQWRAIACDLVFDAASRGKQFLIVGTKNKAADSVARAAIRARCHYVNKKWLGGMLTNWSTTETRLHKFRDLRTEQKAGRLN
ncbi:hypothetical protein EUGRSUZ_H00775, partial [Eucalyptus grandis]